MVEEKVFLLHAFLLGVRVCFIYDWLRILRRAIPHGDGTVALEDILFWIYCGAEVFLLMQRESDGNMRWFAMLGAFAGMLLYRRLVSPWFVKYLSRALRKIIGWILRPLRFLKRVIFRLVKRVKIRLTYYLKMLKMTLKTR